MPITRWILTHAPGPLALGLLSLRRAVRPSPVVKQNRALLARLAARSPDHTVLAGPFAGLRLGDGDFYGRNVNKILGAYELEITPAIERLITHHPDRVIDIGAADGYFAVGLARRLPEARVIAFDSAPIARSLTRRLAALNGVSGRITLRGACTPSVLRDALAGAARPAVLCDCEGYEDVLMDPSAVPALRSAMILVELHDMFAPGVTRRIRERFAATHAVDEFVARPRAPADAPPGLDWSDEELLFALDEGRWGQSNWMWMTPK